MNLKPITECFVVVETSRDGKTILHGMELDSSDAFELVCKVIEGRGLKESSNPDHRSICTTDESTIEIRPCPCYLELL